MKIWQKFFGATLNVESANHIFAMFKISKFFSVEKTTILSSLEIPVS
jgi:hypothetical protein